MNGKLGSLWVGKTQVGGIRDWNLSIRLIDYGRDVALLHKLSGWNLTASSYWLYDTPKIVVVRLYADHGKGYWEGKGSVTSYTKKLWDALIHENLDITGEGVLEGKE